MASEDWLSIAKQAAEIGDYDLAERAMNLFESEQAGSEPERTPNTVYENVMGSLGSLLGGASFEFADELGAAAATPFTYLDPDYTGLSIPERYRKAKGAINAPRERFAEEHPYQDMFATGVGGLATGKPYTAPRVPPQGLIPNAVDAFRSATSAPANMARGWGAVPTAMNVGAKQGALYGAGTADTMGDYQSAIEGGLLGGALGGAIPGGLMVGREVLGRTVSPYVTDLMRRGVTPTPGQIVGGAAKRFEENLTSRPIIGSLIRGSFRRGHEQFNKAMLDDVLEPIGERADGIGYEGIRNAHAKVSKAYDDLLPDLTIQLDDVASRELRDIDAISTGMSDEAKRRLDTLVQKLVRNRFEQSGRIHPETFKELESDLTKYAADFKSSGGGYDERKIGEALEEINMTLRRMVERGNPGKGERLKKINKAYAKLVRAERGAAGAGAKEGVMTPAQFGRAVAGSDRSKRKQAVAQGKALMQDLARAGEEVLSQREPDSGTPARLFASGSIFGGLGAAGAGGATGMVDPTWALPLIGALAYTPGTQRALAKTMTAPRPAWATAASNRIPSLIDPRFLKPTTAAASSNTRRE